jgi:hypothetical protein
MVLLSFSVKEDELKAGTKVRTTRLFTPEKYSLWNRTLFCGDLLLDGYWKPRTKEGYCLFRRPGKDLYVVVFRDLNGRPWPCRSRESGLITPMSTDEFNTYLREEGFEHQLEEFLRFFETHYDRLDSRVFQSIAFPPVKGVE